MEISWKPLIITLTELPEARKNKIDASFFPPATSGEILAWEEKNAIAIPDAIRSFLLQSDGLEAQRGEIWPVRPLAQWELICDYCASPHPWIRFGQGREHLYLLSLGHSPSIYRHGIFASDEEFFAPHFHQFLIGVFRNEV